MLLYYRLSSEHAGSYRQCMLSCSALSLAEVKHLLAARCGLASEYGRKIDFRIFLAGSQTPAGAGAGEELTEIVDENQMIHAYSKVVLQRVAITYGGSQSVLHKARSELSQEEWKTAEERKWGGRLKRLPPEWLCVLCHRVMTNPVLVRCASNCAQSACLACLEARLGPNRICPFCNSPFRQAIRNKRLQEIIALANLSEFEPAPGAAGGGQHPGQQRQLEAANSASSTGEGSRDATCSARREGQADSAGRGGSRESLSAAGAGLRDLSSGGKVSEEKEADEDARVDSSTSVHTPGTKEGCRGETDWLHFVYLVPQENLTLMRQYDMMVVESSSNLALALAPRTRPAQRRGNGTVETASESGDPTDGEKEEETRSDAGDAGAGGATNGPEDQLCGAGKNTNHQVFLVPLCSAGGGTSFSIAGFARVSSSRHVDPESDSAAAAVAQQWQSSPGRASALPAHPCSALAFGVYNITWDSKFTPMPMLPSRKQPLCSLLGAHRRQFNASGVPAVPGLLKREVFGGGGASMIEAVVEAAKYEEVLTCIKDYAQFGSRPAEPWQYSTPQTSARSAAGPGMPKKGLPAAGLGQEATRVPPPPPPPSAGEGSVRSSGCASAPEKRDVSSEGRGRSDVGSVSSSLSRGASRPGSLNGERKETGGVFGIPVSLGPPSLSLRGDPGQPSNPYLGYCALLPFLTEEQFRHIRRLQKRAMEICGYTQPLAEPRKRRRSGKKKRGKDVSRSVGSRAFPSDEPLDGCDHVEGGKQGTDSMCACAPTRDTNAESLSIQNAASVTRRPVSDPDCAKSTGSRVRGAPKALPRVPPVLRVSATNDKTDTDTTRNKDTGDRHSQGEAAVVETCKAVEENVARVPSAGPDPDCSGECD
ncbi:unnamed protein product [Neospora caninum Liverpool]|uniref:Dense granular protein GRA10, putative n=1 Tax=Neospora caninum (strain Liverpool) TaxID=572307 RepID=F0VJQ2_NEOCL|nr:uncharacterized protein NCLIV_037450 [Neospora caninum Liverpool]CBZ53963.1 unnamed protein product [Neospora caninum Liverpool]CEL67964.1 TPA: dense granular protein GRA10, putative [Neospora caninum Liverpool]|eukprot:XP_003883995.1 uncharacterized protein NCLIV_037450 [Neospora caninum Liverpool]